MKTIGSSIILALTLLFISSCGSLIVKITPEYIENNILDVEVYKFESGREGFEQLTIEIRNKSNKELEFSAQSFFEDAEGHYNMINLPSKMNPNVTRTVAMRRTYYKGEDSVSFGFTGNFWGITGFELDSGSGWRVSNSDLNVHDIYLTLIFKINNEIYSNTYHLNN
jgi:3D (Asp-Asp-Asp) domain-containing protein